MEKSLKNASVRMFTFMFGIIFLLNLNYTVLKSVRKTLAIADLGGSATSIPFFELFGTMPAAVFMAWFLTKILKKFSMRKVFFVMLFLFISFFILFAGLYYPQLIILQKMVATPKLLTFASMIFYVVGELWKPCLIQILFLGLVNMNLSMDQAKSYYPSLMLGASIGAIAAGPITVFCNSKYLFNLIPLSTDHWNHSLITMMSVVFLTSILTASFYHLLCKNFARNESYSEEGKKFSLKEALRFFLQSKPLKLMGWIVFADYIAYSLAEVLFLEVLKLKYPHPTDYCSYMGYLSFWHSVLTIFSALFLAPILLKKTRWVTSAIILPLGLFISEGIFFFFLCAEEFSSALFNLSHNDWLGVLVMIGSFLFCSCRAIKYTLFDPCKELALVSLPKASRMQGKLIIDGLCSKFGKGASSAATLSFVSISGSLLGSSTITGIIALLISLSLVVSTTILGEELEQKPLPSSP